MQFDAKTIEVRGLLSSGHKYVIPRYQREYSWEKHNMMIFSMT